MRNLIESSSSISVSYLSKILGLKEEIIMEITLDLITSRKLNVKIDGINKTIYMNEKDELKDVLQSTTNYMRKEYLSNFEKYSQNLLNKELDFSSLEDIEFERVRY